MNPHPDTTLLAGLDIGSTHCKALLTDLAGNVVARAQRGTPRDRDGHTHPRAKSSTPPWTRCAAAYGGRDARPPPWG
ncbi:hypothetical protein GCM10017744_002990 [Streptomyces antimycoticus]